ncbi:class I SAM-dependent methyltransferase [Fulvivirgaceae bacterium BMA12]|uniref:Class I SAM-dependent methyltransferase n=1 Tax=Agaribacillus aureus TaxID=3051825 RepID=A0ABT8LHL8_9BACT|nr:class I SAM-dependent methyltransferase [Fulvivirgaceae bacterium BMA12]
MKDVELFEKERAANYDDFISVWMPHYQFVINLLPALVKDANDTGNKELLVVGCGTGNEILAFRQSGLDWPITGIDPSPEMIALARKKVADHKNISIACRQVQDLAPSGLFGAATLILVLHFLPDDGAKQNLLESISSRLEANSPFVLVDIFGDQNEIRQNLDILRHTLPADMDPVIIDERLEKIKTQIHYIPEKRLIGLLEAAGFEKPVRFHQSTIYGGWITKKI